MIYLIFRTKKWLWKILSSQTTSKTLYHQSPPKVSKNTLISQKEILPKSMIHLAEKGVWSARKSWLKKAPRQYLPPNGDQRLTTSSGLFLFLETRDPSSSVTTFPHFVGLHFSHSSVTRPSDCFFRKIKSRRDFPINLKGPNAPWPRTIFDRDQSEFAYK